LLRPLRLCVCVCVCFAADILSIFVKFWYTWFTIFSLGLIPRCITSGSFFGPATSFSASSFDQHIPARSQTASPASASCHSSCHRLFSLFQSTGLTHIPTNSSCHRFVGSCISGCCHGVFNAVKSRHRSSGSIRSRTISPTSTPSVTSWRRSPTPRCQRRSATRALAAVSSTSISSVVPMASVHTMIPPLPSGSGGQCCRRQLRDRQR
jgi:hypothetical protein